MNKIPKVIHYCWFGGKPLPQYAINCIDSWKKYCPDYEIVEWNESNYDVTKIPFMKEAYDNRKWGFVPDYARLDIIFHNGGIYLDTDVELIKNLDFLLSHSGFAGCETDRTVNLGLGFGAEKNNKIVYEMMKYYENKHFVNLDGSLNLIPSPSIQTETLLNYGFKINDENTSFEDFYLYNKSYFNPYNLKTGLVQISNSTVSIHHYKATWSSKSNKIHTKISQILFRLHLDFFANLLKKIHRKLTK